MIVTTTNSIEGSPIREYRGIVFGEVITGINVFKDIGAGLRNFFGGRSAGYEVCRRAERTGANAVVGVDIDYEVLGTDNGMLMVSASGTAVVV